MEDFRIRSTNARELVISLRECGFHVTDTDFVKPNAARTVIIYKKFLFLLVPWSFNTITDLTDNGAHRLHPLLGASPIPSGVDEISLFVFLQQLLSSIQYRDFQLTDMLTPTPHRQLVIFTALNNFASVAVSCKRIIRPFSGSLEQQTMLIDNLLHEKINSTELCAKRELQKQQEALFVETSVQENDQIRDKLIEYRKEAEVITNVLEDYRKERQQLKDNVTGVHYALMECKRVYTITKENVDIDVDEMHKQIASLNQQAETTRQEYVKEQQELRQNKQDLILLKTKSGIWDEINESKSDNKRLIKELKRMHKSLDTIKNEEQIALDYEVKSKQESDQRALEITTNEVALETLEEHDTKLQETMNTYWDARIKKNAELEEELRSIRNEEHSVTEECRVLDKEYNDIMNAHNSQIRQVQSKASLLEAHIERLYLNSQEI